MKKSDLKYVLILIGIGCAVGLIPTIRLALHWSGNGIDGGIGTLIFVFVACAGIANLLLFTMVKSIVFSINIKKLTERFGEHSFHPVSTFQSSGGNFYIDPVAGKVAAITKLNPFAIQVVEAARVQDPTVDDGSSMSILKGTRLVSFRFTIDGQKWRVPTFISRQTYSLKSSEVLTAISKADMQVEMINEAKAVSMQRG